MDIQPMRAILSPIEMAQKEEIMEKLAENSNYLTEVREQYENYPYPPRNPENEKTTFCYSHSSALDCLNYYNYSGKRDFTKGFRALVAGGGTGDALIMLAEQFRYMTANVTYLDISRASMQVAQDRAKVRGLHNITWVHGSILDAPQLLNGKFDYINCEGVLHHLESPEAGLAALTAVLKDDGIMGLMLYAKYGREEVYRIQNLMRILNKDENDMRSKVENCKSVLKNLPETNIFRNNNTYGDIDIYDTFLHCNDVAYSIPDVYKFLAGSKLKPTHFFFHKFKAGNDLYRLESYVKDGSLSGIIDNLSVEEKQTAAELMHGKMVKHSFYASKISAPVPSADDLNNVPALFMLRNKEAYQDLYTILKSVQVGQPLICKAASGEFNSEIRFIKTANAERIFAYMDGNKSIGEILESVISSYPDNIKKPGIQELKEEFKVIFAAFNIQDWMFLRDKSVPGIKSVLDIQNHLTNALAEKL